MGLLVDLSTAVHSCCARSQAAIAILATLALAALLAGCGSSSALPPPPPAPTPVQVKVAPATASVAAGGAAVAFAAEVQNATNAGVTWQVNGAAGGNVTYGIISPSGSYSSPASVPSPPTVTVSAVSVQDPSRSATAQVTILSALPPVNGSCGTANGVPVSIAPSTNLCSVGSPSPVSGTGPWTWNCAGSNAGSTASCAANLSGPITGRAVPAPIYGVTLDSLGNLSAELNSLQQMVHRPTARIVFDAGQPASAYLAPIQQLRTGSYIMGELADSSYMPGYTVASIASWAQSYAQTLGNNVDIWEIGNEVNGDWLGAATMAKVEAMYDAVASQGGITALTFYYEGEPSDPGNCIAATNGGNDMFTWINQNFQLNVAMPQRSAETEQIRQNLGYVLVSWYPDQCPGEDPDWPLVYTQLAAIFPNARVGFGELGTANPQNGSAYEVAEINQYYPLAKALPGLPPNYIGGYFWWYFAEEMVPWGTTVLSSTLNSAIQ